MGVSVSAIVVAAGSGSRMDGAAGQGQDQSAPPKQFMELGGRPLLLHALRPFEDHPLIETITIVLPRGLVSEWEERLRESYGLKKIGAVVPGGARRQDSVRAGMEAVSGGSDRSPDALVAVHDGVRPLLGTELLGRVISAAMETGAAVPVIPVADTVVETDGGHGWAGVADRSRLALVQTPQVFRAEWLEAAHRNAEDGESTDDAQMVRALGHPIRLVEGDPMNLKVTTPEDLELVRRWMAGAVGT